MASFRQMTNEGIIKRADAEKIELDNLFFEPGFNPPGRNEEDEAEDEELFQHIMQYGLSQLPQWVVRPREAGGVWLVDGHRRTIQTRRAVAAGLDLVDEKTGKIWIPIKQFIGNDEDRLCFIVDSNKNKRIKALQTAWVYKQLIALGRSKQEIAGRFKCSVSAVDNYLTFGNANADVQNAVRNGVVSTTEAIKLVRANKESAGAVIAAEVTKAHAAGKKRVTAATMRPWAPPIKFSAPIVSNAKRLLDSMPADILAKASNAASMDDEDQTVSVTLSSKALFLFVQTVETVEALRREAEEKQREKAARAGQAVITGVANS
jgi:ParB family chromosome partitioning protein